jgi:hypothetical protein
VRVRENDWEIDVRDQGPGVSEQDKARIFKPFYQGHAPQHSQINGTGLGLSVARDCIEAQGGSLQLVDDALTGACFRIILPIKVQDRASIANKENKDEAAKYQNHHPVIAPGISQGNSGETRGGNSSALTLGSGETNATITTVNNAVEANEYDSTPIDRPLIGGNRTSDGIVRPLARKAAAS